MMPHIGDQVRDKLTGIEGTLTAFTGKTEAPDQYAMRVARDTGGAFDILWLTPERLAP